MAKFELFVDDNCHHMDDDERYLHGTYDTYEEAVAATKKIIDNCLAGVDHTGMTSEQLYSGWAHYGDNPFIVGDLDNARIDELVAQGKAILAELESRMGIHITSPADILKSIDLPPSNKFSASDYARERCREICREEDAVALKLRYLKWPEELDGFKDVLARCLERPDISRDDIKALETIRKSIEQFPKAMPPKPYWYWLRLEDGPVSYTAYFHPDRFEFSSDGYEDDIKWKVHYYGSGRQDVRTGNANDMAHTLRLMEISACLDEGDASILKVSA